MGVIRMVQKYYYFTVAKLRQGRQLKSLLIEDAAQFLKSIENCINKCSNYIRTCVLDTLSAVNQQLKAF